MRLLSGMLLVALAASALSDASGTGRECADRAVPHFADVTASTGITFQHTFDPTKKYIPESMSGGVLLIDYDRDGWLDIYFTNAPTIAMMQRGEKARSELYHNNHDGTFTNVSEEAGVGFPCAAMGGAVGDYNNDGWPDMVITCLDGDVLYRNNGDGTFTNVAQRAGLKASRWFTGAAFADYDHDGFLDLMMASYVAFDIAHLPQPGSSTTCIYRGTPVQCGPHGLKGGQDALFHNNADGTFRDVSAESGVSDKAGYYGLGVLWADLGGDGLPSLFVANDSTPNYLYRNRGHGRFDEVGLASGVALDADGKEQADMGVTAGDYLHTGRQSLYATTFSDEVKPLYRNDGNWVFNEVASASGVGATALRLLGWGTSFGDFDNDGWLDLMTVYGHVYPQVDAIAATAGYREPKTLFLNRKDGTFCDATPFAGPALSTATAARGLAVGDLFNDGNLDAVIENIDGSPMILRNQGNAANNHWIEFELTGTRSNRSAIGAELQLTAAGMTQTAEIRSGDSYLSQSDLRAHFGVAYAPVIDKVQIRWPSGRVEVLHQLRANRIYALLEDSGIVDRSRVVPEAPRKGR